MGRDVGEVLTLSDPAADRGRARVGRTAARPRARAHDARRDPQAGHRRPVPRLRRGRRAARRPDAADDVGRPAAAPGGWRQPVQRRTQAVEAGTGSCPRFRSPRVPPRLDPELARNGEHRRRPPRRAPSPHCACARPRRAASRRRRTAPPPPAAGRSRAVIRASSGSPRPRLAGRRRPGSRSRPTRSRGCTSCATHVVGDEAVVAARHAPGVDPEAVALGTGAADEALLELGRAPARRAARAASTASSKLGGAGGETAGSPGRASATSASPSSKQPARRRRASPRAAARAAVAAAASPRRRGADGLGEQPGRVAAVRRGARPAEAAAQS